MIFIRNKTKSRRRRSGSNGAGITACLLAAALLVLALAPSLVHIKDLAFAGADILKLILVSFQRGVSQNTKETTSVVLHTLGDTETAATLHGEHRLVDSDLKGAADDVAHDAHVSTVANKLLRSFGEAEESTGERRCRISKGLSFAASFIVKLVQLDRSTAGKKACTGE